MSKTSNNRVRRVRTYRRPDTRFSDDGCTVFCRLRVDRRQFEYAKKWAIFHIGDPTGSAEEQLEGYLNVAMMNAIAFEDWHAPPEIEALYPKVEAPLREDSDDDDYIPF